jgi:hypothetical protein
VALIYYDDMSFDSEIKFEVYILYKYLNLHYDNEIAEGLLKENKNNLDALAKALGKNDIAFFCEYFLKNVFVPSDNNVARTLSDAHRELWDVLNETFVNDKHDKVNIIEPRGFAKTTFADFALCIWLVSYRLSEFTLLGAKKDDDATQFMDSVKKEFGENTKLISNFGKLVDSKGYKVNANEIEFTNGMYIRAVGSASSVRGANFKGVRPTVIITDDYQDEKDILTEEARDKKYNRFTKEIEQVGDKAVYRHGKKIKSATKIVNVGTVLHCNCLVSRLSRNNDYYTVLRRAILLEDGQTVDDIFESELWLECKRIYFDDKLKSEERKVKAFDFYQKHYKEMKFPVLWEEKWDCFKDLAVPYWENRIAFTSEMMNDASSIGEKWFKSNRTMASEEVEDNNFIKTILCIDPAGVKNKKKGDSFAFVVESLADNDFKYVRKGELLNFVTFDEYINHTIDVLKEFDDITHVGIEKNTYLGLDVDILNEKISKDEELRSRDIQIINEMQRQNKDAKISTVVDPVNNGRIIFDSNRVMKAAIDEMMDFQGQLYTLHDDFIDCVAEASNRLDTIEVVGKLQVFDIRKLGL